MIHNVARLEVFGNLVVATQFKTHWTTEGYDERKLQFAINHPMSTNTGRDYFGRIFWDALIGSSLEGGEAKRFMKMGIPLPRSRW